jgi:hypothetical protein
MSYKPFAIFTVIVGNYDTVKQPIVIDDRFDYIIFTDTPITNPSIWQVRQVTYESKKQWLKARYPRLNTGLCLSEYEASLYIDGNIQITAYSSLFDIPLFASITKNGISIN